MASDIEGRHGVGITLGLMMMAVAWANASWAQSSDGAPAMAQSTTVPAATDFACGSGFTYFRVAVSTHGNIREIESPEGVTNLFHPVSGGSVTGYQICWDVGAGFFTAFDVGDGGEAGWGAAIGTSQPNGPGTFPLEITRTTADGSITMTRRITGNSFVMPAAGNPGGFDLNGDGHLCSTLAECGNCTNRTKQHGGARHRQDRGVRRGQCRG